MMAKKKKEMPANPIAVVTGASRGIGKAVALALGKMVVLYINTYHNINNNNHNYHHHIKPVNYASNEAMALEVVEEIKARTASNGMIAIITIIIFEQISSPS